MLKYSIVIASFLSSLFLTQATFADVAVRITDLPNKIMEVTYSFLYDRVGSASITLPENGFEFATGPIKVVSVIDTQAKTPLKYEIVKPPKGDPKLQAVKVLLPTQIPRGGRYEIDLTVSAKSGFINQLSSNVYEFLYKTGHLSYFEVPTDHALTYTSQPVILLERGDKTIAQGSPSPRGLFYYKTKSFGKVLPEKIQTFTD